MAALPACVDQRALWDRMNSHGFTQNEVARLAGISSSHLSQIMNGQLGQTQVQGQGGRKDQPGIGHQAAVVEGDLDPVGVVAW